MAVDHQQNLHQYLTLFLSDALSDVHTREKFYEVCASLDRTMKSAIAHVGEKWNARASPTLSVLPPEILALCFTHLDFDTRMRMGQVCRAWRALSHMQPRLWADCTVTTNSMPHFLFVCEFIERSGCVPLDLEIKTYSHDVMRSTYALTQREHHRVRRLILPCCFADLFSFPAAPLLESFHAVASGVIVGYAPRIRYLWARTLHLNDPYLSLSTLEAFCGDIAGEYSVNFFGICPNIQALELNTTNSESISHWPHSSAPASLKSVALRTLNANSDEYLQYFCRCTSLENVVLCGKFTFASVISLFQDLGHHPRVLSIGDWTVDLLSETEPSLRVRVLNEAIYAELSAGVQVPTLRELVIYAVQALQDVSFPTIERLTLHLRAEDIGKLAQLPNVFISAPALQVLTFHHSARAASDREWIGTLIKHMGTFCRARLVIPVLHSIVLVTAGDSASIESVDINSLLLYANHVYYGGVELFPRVI